MQVKFRFKEGVLREAVVASRGLARASGGFVLGLIDQGFDVFGRPKEVFDLLRMIKADTFLEAVNVTGWVGMGLILMSVHPEKFCLARWGKVRRSARKCFSPARPASAKVNAIRG